MAKNNFKAKEATDSANYAQGIGQLGQSAAGAGLQQQGQGFNNLQDTFQQQKGFAQMLQDAAAGKGGPSLADQQVLDTTARNNANAAGFAAGAKGLNPALAARQALMAQAGNNQQAAGQAAQTRIQEQQAARAQLGGALAGEAGTAGGETSAGAGLFGTGAGAANQSNANLIQSRSGANQINADVAKQNAGAINGMIGGVMNAAGGAFGLAEGGEVPGEPPGTQSPETEIALAYGGGVPHEPSLSSTVRSPAMPRRSFAAQVAHHLAREYFDEGGEAGHGSYDFPAMDLRHAKPHPKAQPRTESGASTTMFIPHDYHTPDATAAQHEGEDSEGKQKPSINRAYGGDVGEDYDPAVDEDEPESGEDNEPDTEELRLAEGGDAGDESAGLDTRDMSQHTNAAVSNPNAPNARQRIGAALSAFGSSMGGGPAAFKLSDLKQRQPSVAAPPPSAGSQAPIPAPAPVAVAPTPMPAPMPAAQAMADGGSAGSVERDGVHYALRPGETPEMFHAHMDALAKTHNPTPAQVHRDDAKGIRFTGDNVHVSEGGDNKTLEQATGRTHASGGKKLTTSVDVKEPVQAVAKNFKQGGPVPGQALVPGNSLKNDVVDAKLSPGEVVLPRTISHNPKQAKRFVELLQDGHDGHSALAALKGKRK